jgi:transglutaminase-like putative cysteine protease
MEPVGTNVFFLAATAQTLQGDYGLLSRDSAGSIFDIDFQHPVNRYEATSNLAEADPGSLRSSGEDYPLDVLLNYTKLPPLDPRIPRLASQITASADNNYDRAVTMENYLRTHFAYSLQLSRRPPRDPLAEFLFERRQGHCEYFASSMAVMLRSLRIPSRIVNGFRTGEFNDLTSQYVVRASNAHSWVEAYFPGYGWVAFDPTPSDSLPAHTGWSRAALYLDAMASFWREWVINYDLNRQRTLGANVASRGQRWLRDLRIWWISSQRQSLEEIRHMWDALAGSPLRWIVGAILAGVLILLGANTTRLWSAWVNRRLAAHPEKSPGKAATIWYERMTRVLARRGWRKSPAQTPREFQAGIGDPQMRRQVERFTQHYANARFGESAEDAQRLPELYDQIESNTKP